MGKLITAIVALALIIPNLSSAEYNGRKLAEAVSAYLFSVATIEYMQSSKCGYLYNTTYSLDQATRDALLHFNNKDRHELTGILRDQKPKIESEAKSVVDGALAAIQEGGIDWKSSCGMLSGTLSSSFTKIRNEYESAISIYSK